MSLKKNAALVGITAILMVYIPRYFRSEPPVITGGSVAPGFEEVQQTFRENFETGRDPRHGGSAFSAYYRGKKVVDIWGGYADVESKQVWKEDTLTIVFSSTKGIAALCIAMLADRGLLDYDKPVALYWPEFAQNGKEKMTVRQMLDHKGGLILAAPPGLSLDVLRDVAKAGELMAATEPLWIVDDLTHGFHVITFGPLTNELLRRVDPKHRTMGQFFDDEVAKPFGIDFHIGLPFQEQYRAARSMVDHRPLFQIVLDGISSPLNRRMLWHMMTNNLLQKALENAGDITDPGVFNDPANRVLELPSANGFGKAEALAKVYGILSVGGTDPATNKTLLSKHLVDDFMKARPATLDYVAGIPLSFNRGMIVGEVVNGVKMFGHFGIGGQFAYAVPQHQLGFSFVSRFVSPFGLGDDPRCVRLLEVLCNCIRKLED